MFDHLGITVTDLDRSVAFYTKVLAPFGYKLVKNYPGAAAGFGPVSKGGPNAQFWIAKGNGPPAGPRIHVAFSADRKGVDAFYAAAMANGAKDNGPPGLRPHYHANYYGAFVIDADGYNVEAVCHAPPAAPKAAKRATKAKRTAPASKRSAKPTAKRNPRKAR
jgi:catechol 2,3-dioxygenase-like lactoylglutathione lyase family enzyme